MNNKEFTEKYYVNRKGTDSVKWDEGPKDYDGDITPCFIADMDFRCPECVIEGMKEQVEFGLFGYAHLNDSYYDEWIRWNETHHHVTYKKEWLRFSLGAIAGIYSVINTFTEEGDAIMVMMPSYPPFRGSVKGTDRKLVETELIDNNGHFEMDYADIEAKIQSEDVKMIIFCSPHNPSGRVWTREEIQKLLDIAMKHDVLVLSDEVHQDLLMPGHTQTPILSMGEEYYSHLVVINACAKTFNLAQLSNSHVLIPDENLRNRYDAFTSRHHMGSAKYLNAMASYYAYKDGSEWLEGVLSVVKENYDYLRDTLTAHDIEVADMEGTYLAFVNLEKVLKGRDIGEFVTKTCKFLPNMGVTFGENYASWVRINLATSFDNIKTVVDSIVENI